MISKLNIFQILVAFLIILQSFFVLIVMVNIVDFSKVSTVQLKEFRKTHGIRKHTKPKSVPSKPPSLPNDTFQASLEKDDEQFEFTYPEKNDPNAIDPLDHLLTLFSVKMLQKLPLFYAALTSEPDWAVPLPWPSEAISIYHYVGLRPSKTPEQRKIYEHLRDLDSGGAVYDTVGDTLQDSYVSSEGREYGRDGKMGAEEEAKRMVSSILTMIKEPTVACKRVVKMGGRYCKMMPDGEKYMCLDPGMAPEPFKCLVYSFGIGHDFSFDKMMGLYGCESFAFDDDDDHAIFPVKPYYNVYFSRVRMSNKNVQVKTEEVNKEAYMYVYRPLDNIMYELKHFDDVLDYLKLDIEGSEWDVFSDSIFKTDILDNTRFLALETHFYDFINSTIMDDPVALYHSVKKYYRFFKEIENRGFQLLHFEPNFLKPRYAAVLGRLVPVFAEMVWVNLHAPPGKKHYYPSPVVNLIDKMEIN